MTPLQALYGRYKPSATPQPDWQLDFFKANIPPVMCCVAPKSRIHIRTDDALFLNAHSLQYVIMDYVWTNDASEPDFSPRQVAGGANHFIYRPNFLRCVEGICMFEEGITERSLGFLWNAIAFTIRRFLHKNRLSQMHLLTTGDLLRLGIEGNIVQDQHWLTEYIIHKDNLEGFRAYQYVDASTIGAYVIHKVFAQARREKRRIRPEHVAEWVQI
jgi:hypothetical protein